jgi:hypothetical protein
LASTKVTVKGGRYDRGYLFFQLPDEEESDTAAFALFAWRFSFSDLLAAVFELFEPPLSLLAMVASSRRRDPDAQRITLEPTFDRGPSISRREVGLPSRSWRLGESRCADPVREVGVSDRETRVPHPKRPIMEPDHARRVHGESVGPLPGRR